ncbi:MAG: HipA N-terminal domain-containing protein, partial [Archangium sp.]|nr:HipA N-terminal domain-containing protein [Archangium sp.]
MRLAPARAIRVFFEPEEGRRLLVGGLALKNRQVLFEYDADFIASGLELSPFKLPLGPGVMTGDPAKFDGLMGVFDDSLPDGWGRLLIDRRAAKAGIAPEALSPLDRLLLVGHRGMGALVYEPQVELEPPTVVQLLALEADTQAVMRGVSAVDLDRLVALGGSPQGARPKVLVQLSSDGTVLVGDSQPRPGFEPWLVKFRSRDDDQHAASLEHAYLLMAAAAGIDAPASRLLGRTSRHPARGARARPTTSRTPTGPVANTRCSSTPKGRTPRARISKGSLHRPGCGARRRSSTRFAQPCRTSIASPTKPVSRARVHERSAARWVSDRPLADSPRVRAQEVLHRDLLRRVVRRHVPHGAKHRPLGAPRAVVAPEHPEVARVRTRVAAIERVLVHQLLHALERVFRRRRPLENLLPPQHA